jgi:hypothetical protein
MSGQMTVLIPVAAQTFHMMLLVISFKNALFALFFSCLNLIFTGVKLMVLRRKGNKINLETLEKLATQAKVVQAMDKKAQQHDFNRQSGFLNRSMGGRISVFSGLGVSEVVKRNKKRKLGLLVNAYTNLVLKWTNSVVFVPQYLFTILLILKDKETYEKGLLHPWLVWTNVVIVSMLELAVILFSAKHLQSRPGFTQLHFFEKIQYKLYYSNKLLFLLSWFFCHFLAILIFNSVYSEKL